MTLCPFEGNPGNTTAINRVAVKSGVVQGTLSYLDNHWGQESRLFLVVKA
jgi:hypothetical protein